MKVVEKLKLVLAVLFLAGCSMPQQKDSKIDFVDEPFANIEQNNDLFEVSENSEVEFVFKTNNKSFIREDGYTIWCEKFENNTDNFIPIKCKVQKISGISEMGYGIIFCSKTESLTQNYLLTVLINTKQQYNVGKVKNGKFISLSNGWNYSNVLYAGNSVNEIEVDYINDGQSYNKKFKLKLNGYEIIYFSDPEQVDPVFKNTMSGYVASISPLEDFDTSRVEVKYIKQ